MDIPYVRGRVASQAHVALPEGTVEEEYARNGFFGRYAHLYREHAPVAWTRIEGPLRPRLFALGEVAIGDYLASRATLLANRDCRIHIAAIAEPMPYLFRNADGDELSKPNHNKHGQHTQNEPTEKREPSPDERSQLAPGQGSCRPNEWQVVIQRQRAVTSVCYPHCPLDVVGWKGA